MSSVSDSAGWKEGVPGKALHGSLRLQLHTLHHISPIYNVLAILGGTEEPGKSSNTNYIICIYKSLLYGILYTLTSINLSGLYHTSLHGNVMGEMNVSRHI